MISQHTDNPCPRARHDAHVRARQNFNMLKITYKQFWARTRSFRAFSNFPSVGVRARVVRTHSANEWQKFKFFTWFGFLIQQLTISIDFQSLLTFHKAVRARQSLKSARAAMGNIMQKWAKTCHFQNKIALKIIHRILFFLMVGKSMSSKYDFIPPWLHRNARKSSNWHLN